MDGLTIKSWASAVAVVVAVSFSGAWADGSWPCGAEGSDLTCTLENAMTWGNSTLTVSGTGAMKDYIFFLTGNTNAPWGDLDVVIIQSGVTYIGEEAFFGYVGPTKVIVYATTPPAVGKNAFSVPSSVKASAILRVPEGSIDAYKAADGWKDFGYINPSTVTFKDQIGADYMTQLVSYGDTATEPPEPPYPGMSAAIVYFHGWYTEQAAGTKWNFNTPVISDTTLYARWGTTLAVAPRTSPNLSGLVVRQSGRQLRITLPNQSSSSRYAVELYNVAGKRQKVSPVHHPDGMITVTLPHLAAGSYVLRVVNGNDRLERRVMLR